MGSKIYTDTDNINDDHKLFAEKSQKNVRKMLKIARIQTKPL